MGWMGTSVSAKNDRRTCRANPWSLTILCLLHERPMHPYEAHRRILERHEEKSIDLKRGSLYHAFSRLREAGLIEAIETTRNGHRPERTVFQVTKHGECEMRAWLRGLLANPELDATQFRGALGSLDRLSGEEICSQLRTRAGILATDISRNAAELDRQRRQFGRTTRLEHEYAQAMREAELNWVRSLIEDIEECWPD